jgi:hypothetical protein
VMDEVLIDGRELGRENLVQCLDDLRIALHDALLEARADSCSRRYDRRPQLTILPCDEEPRACRVQASREEENDS